MTFRCFIVLLIPYVIVTCILAGIVYLETDKVDGFHYAIDTMTLRGRIGDPDDLEHPFFFKIAEDIAALLVFVIFGFGLSFMGELIEARVVKKEFKVETRGGQLKTWKEWLRERDPNMYDQFYGNEPVPIGWWQRFKQCLLDFPR
jgi:hypothetical protein